VWKKVIRIQREFLWGGVKGGKKVSWVKWRVMCNQKSRGGLGVRDVKIVNTSLLSKWRWRLIQPGRPLWKEVLVAKYGSHILHQVDWSNFATPSSASIWWKNIISLDKVVIGKNWLVDSVRRKVGNGVNTSFWSSNWIGNDPLKVTFPRLYSLSNQKESKVAELLVDLKVWTFDWRRTYSNGSTNLF
jgi:hypothetical protein